MNKTTDTLQTTTQDTHHTHRFTPSWWIVFLFIGTLCVTMVIGSFIKSYPNLATGRVSVLDYAGLLFVILCVLPFGVLSLITPFASKIIVSSHGLEYHTLAYTLKANWDDIVNVGNVNRGSSGNAVTLVPLKPDIVLREWAKHAPWNVQRAAEGLGIPVSWFGGLRGRNLTSDIQQ